MKKGFSRLLLLAAFAALQAPGLSHAGKAELPPEVAGGVAAAYSRSVSYYLSRYSAGGPSVGRDCFGAAEKKALETAGKNPILDDLLERLGAEAAACAGLKGSGLAAFDSAVKDTAAYFYVSGERIAEPAVFSPEPPAAAAAAGFPPEVQALPGEELPMHDVGYYVSSQAGPLGALLRPGSAPGRIVFSRSPAPAALALAGAEPGKVWRLRVPGSTYGFEAYLTGGKKPALVLCDFAGASWFGHVLRVYGLLLAERGLEPEVLVDASPAPAKPCPGVLAAFDSGMPRSFQGLLLGYYRELREVFAPYIKEETSGKGFKAFSAVIGTAAYVAVSAEDSWYGDILGATVSALLESGVSFSELYFAGSAGSLAYHTPYTFAYPSCYLDDFGGRLNIPNPLAPAGSGGCHQAVTSPLAETAAYLRALPAEAATIDVEGFGLAAAVAEHNARSPRQLSLATAYLVTDYPRGLKATSGISLADQRLASKLAGTRAYAALLLGRLKDGRRTWLHPAEERLGRGVSELSADNMNRYRQEAGKLSPEEERLARELEAAPPPVIMRLGKNRLRRVLEAGMALAPREIEALTGVALSTSANTPPEEEQLYGAYGYLFAGVGNNNRAAAYGDYQLFISSRAWAARSYATPASGYRAVDKAGGDMGLAIKKWGETIIAPADYAAWLSLAYIRDLRENEAAPPAGTSGWDAISDCDSCYLEGKLPKYFTADEIDCLEAPPGGLEGLPVPDALRGRAFDTPGACAARHAATPAR